MAQANLSWISDTPMTNNDDDKSMNMDSEPSDNFEHASGETISDKENTMKTEVKSVIKDISPVISPINSPVKPKENTTEEVRLMICAPDQLAAENVAKQLPRHKYMGPKKNSKLHFDSNQQKTEAPPPDLFYGDHAVPSWALPSSDSWPSDPHR